MGAIENALASQRPKAGAISDGLGDDIQWSNSQIVFLRIGHHL